jgi:predicted XRE-type DNA-binding protein
MKNEIQTPAYLIKWKSAEGTGFPPEDAIVSKFRADLYKEILRCAQHYSQRELQAIFDEPQPRVSELLHGRIAGKSVEKLMYYASRLGIEVRTSFERRTRNLQDELRIAEGDNLSHSHRSNSPQPPRLINAQPTVASKSIRPHLRQNHRNEV